MVFKKKTAEYYQNIQELLRKHARNKYRNLPEEEKEVKRVYGKDRYKSMTEEKENRPRKYEGNFQAAKKTTTKY